MASRKRTRKKATRKKASLSPWQRVLQISKWLLYLSVPFVIAIAGYLVYLDRTITGTFEGRRWSVPAQVFAQPLELHAGVQMGRRELQIELERLGYQADANLRHPGTFKHRGTALEVYLRAFRFMERERASQRIVVDFADNQIVAISADIDDTNIPLIRLDPATIGSFFPSHGEDRLILRPDQVPTLLSAGLKAIEDRTFDKHAGFSIRGIIRAFMVNLRAGSARQGGSTLTQQLVKSYFLDNRRTLSRKLKELAMAVILDARFSKEDLLTAYINEIFLGQNGTRAIHGFGLGAQFYFNKPLAETRSGGDRNAHRHHSRSVLLQPISTSRARNGAPQSYLEYAASGCTDR